MTRLPAAVKGRFAALLLIWGLGAFGLCGAALADGVVRDGLGAISSGRGGTNIAHCDNGAILLDNPAAMVNIEGRHLSELSFDVLLCDLHYSDPENDTHAEVKPFPLPQLAFIGKSADGRWAIGLGAFAPAGFGAEYDLNGPPAIPGTFRYKSMGALGKILPGVAHRLTDRLSVGATLGVGVSHAELEGPFFLQTGGPIPTVLDLQATGAAITWSVGLQHQLTDSTTWGVTYTSETRLRMDGTAAVDVVGLRSRFDADLYLTWPRSVGLGVRHDLAPGRRLSVDVIWFNWSEAFDSIGLQLSGGTEPLLAPTVSDQLPLNWRDSVSVRLGYEYLISADRVLRAGYVYHPNPIPDATLTPYIPGILEHAFSIGYGKRWDTWGVDLAYQFSFGPDRSVGTSGILGGDFDLSQVEAQAHWMFLSFTRQF